MLAIGLHKIWHFEMYEYKIVKLLFLFERGPYERGRHATFPEHFGFLE